MLFLTPKKAIFIGVRPTHLTHLNIHTNFGINRKLAPGDRVVTRGNERIFPGMPVAGEPLEYELP